jgi:hypothetical protein
MAEPTSAPAAPSPLPTAEPPAPAVAVFEPDPTPYPNPDRGFAADSYYPDEPALDPWGKIAWAEAQGVRIRLIRRTYYLHAYADQEALPPSLLATVAQDLSAAREAGVRLILRFAYRPAENSETAAYCDPPLGRILAHLAQLGPILRAGRGAIAYLEAGLIGPWGEWHSASPEAALLDPLPGYAEGAQPPCGRMNYDRKLPNRKTLEIVEAMLREVPGRLVAVRFPMAKAKLLELAAGGEEGTYPVAFVALTAAEAHRDTLKARLGGHNDCFLASPDDNGTYFYTPGPQQEREKEYWSQDSRYTVMGGETCTPAPYIPSGEDPPAYVYAQFRRFRFNNLNLAYHPDFIRWLAAQPFGDRHPPGSPGAGSGLPAAPAPGHAPAGASPGRLPPAGEPRAGEPGVRKPLQPEDPDPGVPAGRSQAGGACPGGNLLRAGAGGGPGGLHLHRARAHRGGTLSSLSEDLRSRRPGGHPLSRPAGHPNGL